MATSVMERDIGPHEHQMTIYNSYEVYAVCNRCGMHDWADIGLEGFQKKYPDATVVGLDDDPDEAYDPDACQHENQHAEAKPYRVVCDACGADVFPEGYRP